MTLKATLKLLLITCAISSTGSFAIAAPSNVNFTVTMSEVVNVTGCPANCPRIAITVDGQTRYAEYSAGTGTSSLTFTYAPTVGDLDLDGVTLTSPIDLNGGTITDLNGNAISPLTYTVPNTSGIKIDYPSLSMDFTNGANGRYTLNGTAYTDLSSFLGAAGGTFTRASVGTYFDSTGTLQTAAANTPRFDHDPATHTEKGILIEEQRTNLLTRSSEFDNVYWAKSNVSITADSSIAPDGSNNADKIVENTSNSPHFIYVNAGLGTAGNYYTFTIFAKAELRNKGFLAFSNYGAYSGGTPEIKFDLSSGTITSTGTTSRSSIINIGNGWYKISMTAQMTTAANVYPVFGIINLSGASAYTGDGTSGIYLWGAQLEVGSFPTSYIPTTSTAVTRSGDILKVLNSGWFNTANGTFNVTGDINGESGIPSNNNTPLSLGTANNSSFWNVFQSDGRNYIGFNSPHFTYTPDYLDMSGKGFSVAGTYSDAYSSRQGALDGALNTIFGYTGDIITNPITHLGVGTTIRNPTVREFLNGHIQNLKYYPTRVSDTQLQLLTQ